MYLLIWEQHVRAHMPPGNSFEFHFCEPWPTRCSLPFSLVLFMYCMICQNVFVLCFYDWPNK